MSREKIYPYAVARIRVWENKLLNKQTLIQMAEAKSADDSLRLLLEAGYGESGLNINARDFEGILKSELAKTYSLMRELSVEENFIDIFLYKNDYHNLKVLIKKDITELKDTDYLVDGGTIEIDTLIQAVENKNSNSFSELPKIMAKAAKDAVDIYSKTQNGQMIDIILDKAVFESMMETAKLNKNDFIIKYVLKLCDLTNLKSFMRIKRMGKGFDLFKNVYIKEGSISLDVFATAFNSENIASGFKTTAYSTLCENGMSSGFTVFEKLCDNYIMDYVKSAKYQALTLEPLVAYLYAKESEIKTVRIIMTSKINNINAETIKERLREAYV